MINDAKETMVLCCDYKLARDLVRDMAMSKKYPRIGTAWSLGSIVSCDYFDWSCPIVGRLDWLIYASG